MPGQALPAAPPLTEEQRAVVAHDGGPALVFAVAGAGKTTAMTWRVERLVREGVFPARAILATSFSKASVKDIQAALGRWTHCAGVSTQTLHAVGWGLLRMAQRGGHLPPMMLASEDEGGGTETRLLGRTLARARAERAAFLPELDGLDRQDFLTYVGAMKASLWYADLERASLPPSALALAAQAPAPPGAEWYLDLYRLYEQVRAEERTLTFDDMLLGGWECLHRFPEVRVESCRRFECVLVDEFQDVSRVQSEMLDLLTPHRNYMAIGDDDQTIYEWRGASPGFLLGFGQRYGAARYLIGDNFRSPAAPLVLANRVIAHNRNREPKRLSPTRGFGGRVFLHEELSPEQQGRHVAALIAEALAEGRAPAEIAVLVRLYAQTPYLEQALVDAGIAYRVIGGIPFYSRTEVQTLLDYLRLAGSSAPGTGAGDGDARAEAWLRVANRPVRYLPRAASEAIAEALRGGKSLPAALDILADSSSDSLAARLRDLADTLTWLAGVFETLPAGAAVSLLDRKLGYEDWLRRSSGLPETGAGRAENVAAFRRYAEGRGTCRTLLAHLEDLAARGVGRGDSPHVALLSVFRAKGLQWPVVFVPDCNGGVFPHGGPQDVEEERRLFYVALTRTQADLHLHTVASEPPSPFLAETGGKETLGAVGEVSRLLARDPAAWTTAETLALTRQLVTLGLERYLHTWWDAPPEVARAAAHRALSLLAAAGQASLRELLGLSDAHAAPWARFGATPDPLAFPDLAAHAPAPPAAQAPVQTLVPQIGRQVHHPQHGRGIILAVRGDRLAPRLEIQFARGRPVTLAAKFVEFVGT